MPGRPALRQALSALRFGSTRSPKVNRSGMLEDVRSVLNDWPLRVCLPYGLDLLHLAKWVDLIRQVQSSPSFTVCVGQRSYRYSNLDAIELYARIQKDCIDHDLAHSFVVSNEPKSLFFFDRRGRFSFFAAESMPVLSALYPFSREVLWEYFALSQQEEDLSLAEVFNIVHTY